MTDNDDDIARLLRQASSRPIPSPEATARMRAHAHAQWQRAVRRRQFWRQMAVAASLLAIVAGGWLWQRSSATPAMQIARVIRGGDSLIVKRAGTAASRDADPELLTVGDRISTGEARGALLAQLPGGVATYRLDRATRVEWVTANQLRLLAGRIYIDTGMHSAGTAPAAPSGIIVLASGLRITHVGTQFTTALEGERVSIGVRDGAVRVNAEHGDGELRSGVTLARGEMATVDSATTIGAALQRTRVATSGDRWEWVDELAPRVAIEGRPLTQVVRALAYQAGLHIAFATPQVQARADETLLHGPALDMRPETALRTILSTTQFISRRSRDDADTIIIDSR